MLGRIGVIGGKVHRPGDRTGCAPGVSEVGFSAVVAPRTLSPVEEVVTGFGVAAAAVATVGGALAIVMVSVPVTPVPAAEIVAEPGAPGPEYRPEELIDPPPDCTAQVSVGSDIELPN